MNIIVKASRFIELGNIETFYIEVTEDKLILVKKKLISERKKLINCLKDLKSQGIINSIFQPKNKELKKELNRLVLIKRELKNSIIKLNQFFL